MEGRDGSGDRGVPRVGDCRKVRRPFRPGAGERRFCDYVRNSPGGGPRYLLSLQGCQHEGICEMKLKHAFTLLELLGVMSVILIAAALVGPPMNNILKSMHVTQATQTIVNELSIAR